MIEEKNKPNKNPIFNLGKFISEIHSKDLKEDSFTQSTANDVESWNNKENPKSNLNDDSYKENDTIIYPNEETEEDTKKLEENKSLEKKTNLIVNVNINTYQIYMENSDIDIQYYLKPTKKCNKFGQSTNKSYKKEYKNLKQNINPILNNNTFQNQNQIHFNNSFNSPIYGFNNISNNNYNLNKNLFGKIANFEKMKQIGLIALSNPRNVNHYLYQSLVNDSLNCSNNNINPFMTSPFNMNINYSFNNYGNPNPLLNNYMLSQNIFNSNLINTINHINNYKKNNNLEKYSITFKSKTNDPTVEKISKIKVVTSYVKDNLKVKQENNNHQKKEKNIKNIINIDDIISGKEERTVVRLNPIPPNYSSFDISKLLDKYLKIESGKNQRIYKALYTPLCKIIGKNLGYCFVMMVKPKYVVEFYNTFNGIILGKKKCKKPCNVIWGDIQGENFLKYNEEDPTRKPIIFKDIKED